MKSDLKSVIENVAYKLILDYCLPLKLFLKQLKQKEHSVILATLVCCSY